MNDLVYIKKMTALREENLIHKGILYFLLPSFTLGILGMLNPCFFVLIPLQESEVCLCRFKCGPGYWLNQATYCDFLLGNKVMFEIFNWIFLFVLLMKIYRIRHINDETLIKQECVVIFGVWLSFSFVQNLLYLASFYASIYTINWLKHYSFTITYWIIIVRDLTTHLTTLYYCGKLIKSNEDDSNISNLVS